MTLPTLPIRRPIPKMPIRPNPFARNSIPRIPGLTLPGMLGGSSRSDRSSAPPGGGGPYGGSSAYSGILDDFLNQQRADFAAESAADAAQRDAALRRYVISYGATPDFDQLGISSAARGFLSKAIDQKTRDLAAKNEAEGLSVHARLGHENELAQRRIPAQLAARGLLRSGQTGSDLAEQAQNFKIKGFDTLNEMLGSVEGTVGNFLNAERERQRALAEAAMQAALAAAQSYSGSVWGGEDPYGPGGPSGPSSAANMFRFIPQATRNRSGVIVNRSQTNPYANRGYGRGGSV